MQVNLLLVERKSQRGEMAGTQFGCLSRISKKKIVLRHDFDFVERVDIYI